FGTSLAARQLSQAGRFRLASIREDDFVATGQGPTRLRKRIHRSGGRGTCCADSDRRVARSRARHDRSNTGRNGLSAPGLYLPPVRHRRPIQVVSRGWLKVRRPRPDLRAAPPLRALTGRYVEPIAPRASLVAPDTFRFLNLERRCTRPEDWRPTDAAALWTYNLHYFDDLNARDAVSRAAWHRALLQRWVAENPVGDGAAWQPYPVSRRI